MKNEKKMNKRISPVLIAGVGVLAVVVVLALWFFGTYNMLVALDEGVNGAWGNVQSSYQRRADLIPNLVATVQGYKIHEQDVLTDITKARSAWTGASSVADKSAAATAMDSALSRLMVVVENYPNLKANENFLSLQDELAGTENRVNVERNNYNNAVKSYNTKLRSFPVNVVAGVFGFTQKDYFQANAGSETAPKVEF